MSVSEDTKTLEKLERLLRDITGESMVIFTQKQAERLQKLSEINPEDVEHVQRVIRIMRGIDALGSLGGFIKTTLVYAAAILAAIAAFRSGLLDFLGLKP